VAAGLHVWTAKNDAILTSVVADSHSRSSASSKFGIDWPLVMEAQRMGFSTLKSARRRWKNTVKRASGYPSGKGKGVQAPEAAVRGWCETHRTPLKSAADAPK